MEYKSSPSFTKDIDGRKVVGLAAITGNLDDGLDIIHAGAFKRTISHRSAASNEKRVKHLWLHDTYSPPTAAIRSLQEVGKDGLPETVLQRYPDATGGLEVAREYLDTERGNEILKGIEAGAITEMSFGYDPVKFDFEEVNEGDLKGALIRNLRELRLWDTSDVIWGMNSATVAAKSAVPYRDTGKAAEDAEWQQPTLADFTDQAWDDLGEAERKRIAAHFGYSPHMPPESFEELQLAHHIPSKTGVGPVALGGVTAAMAEMMASADIQIGAMRDLYNHISKHYAEYGKQAPRYKLLELAQTVRTVKALQTDTLAGSMSLDLERVSGLLNELDQALRLDSPAQALTLKTQEVQHLMARLQIAERAVL